MFDTGFAHTVLAVLTDPASTECLDTLCTLAGPDTVLMRPVGRLLAGGADHHPAR